MNEIEKTITKEIEKWSKFKSIISLAYHDISLGDYNSKKKVFY